MFNSDLKSIDTTIFLNKLASLLERLNLQYRDGTFQTQEDVIDEFNRAIGEFYDNSTTPFLQLRQATKGTSPNYLEYNDSFKELSWDLGVIFKELSTVEGMVLNNFNYMVSERDKLNKFVKRISSKVGDYVLYSEDSLGDTIYFKDSFNDVSKIDFGSSLLSQKQCDIDVAQGIVTLPVVRSSTPSTRKMKVQINDNSGPGGSIGNYQEIGVAPHDDIRDILDNNPDTWFEYERVQRSESEDTRPFVLDLTFYFDTPQVINFIRINPNNFGIQTSVLIEQIDTSLDGNIFVSIKDDIPISDFLQEDEENVFTLAPSTSKYAGQGLYTFTPRKVKYIHLLLKQNSPYIINTPGGERYRYAIGIRDVEVKAIPYEADGDIVSTSYESPVEIKKVSLLASENPTEHSELADISHQVSIDDGATWYDIQPQDRSGTDIPEILNFNTGVEGTISTASPVYSLRHRMLLSRSADKFKEGASILSEIVEGASDLLSLPTMSPMKIGLTRSPVTDTVRLLNPHWGSRCSSGLYMVEDLNKVIYRNPFIRVIGRSTGRPNQTFSSILDEIATGKIDINEGSNEVLIWIDNDPTWERVGDFSEDNSKQYALTNDGRLIFGDRDETESTGGGRIPPAGALIGLTLKEEMLFPSATSPYTADLVFPTDGDKKSIVICHVDEDIVVEAAKGTTVSPGANVIRLPHKYIVTDSLTFAGTGIGSTFATEVGFQNGSDEFSSSPSGQYSVDKINGIIYTAEPAPKTISGWKIGYSYTSYVQLTESDWDFVVDADRKYNRIAIKDSGYTSMAGSTTTVVGQTVIELNKYAIVPGTITFTPSTPFTGSCVLHEVPYINGGEEFNKQDKEIDISGYYSVDYKRGKIYIADNTAAADITVSFRYTNFFAQYNISKYMDLDSYTIDTVSKTISINEREALKIWGDRDADVANKRLIKAVYDYVKTTRQSIEELEPYFTPIVRDVVLKVLKET